MKNDFLISVVIPCYNLKDHITRTLDSVFAQTYASIEVIAVDDGSTDGTAEILDVYRRTEERLTVIHQQNAGVSAARLTGIKAAKGDYIGFVDGDDLIDKDMYKRLLQNAIDHDADISHCGYRRIYTDKTNYFYNTGKKITCNTKEGLIELLIGNPVEPGLWNKLYKKKLFAPLLSGTSVFDSSIKNNEDLLMNYVLFKNAEQSIFEDFCPYQYIVRNNSAAHGKPNKHKMLDPVKAAKIIWDDTRTDICLCSVAANLYAAKMLQVIQTETDDKVLIHCKKATIKELRGFIPIYLKTKPNRKTKYQVLFATYCSKTYRLIHSVYKKFKNRLDG